ncbi:MAG: coenzyme F420-0:L-glutamate ligase [Natronosporangium sp.]
MNGSTGAAPRLEVLPVRGIGEVTPGADLAELITRAAPWLRDGDVLVVTSKIVSKAEGRLVDLPPGSPERELARADALTAETARPVAARGQTRIVATHHGFVMASAGIDSSNVDSSRLVLLPKDPDASARALRASLARRHGLRVAVVVSDTMGRPWRNGLTDVALGAAGIAPLRDHRGEIDRYGNELRLTQVAVVDQLAAAAELVKGKRDQVPVAVVRGLPGWLDDDGPGVVAALVRDSAHDLFSLGTAEARTAGLHAAATLPEATTGPAPADDAPVRAAVAIVAGHGSGLTWELLSDRDGAPLVRGIAGPNDPEALVRLGSDLHRLRAALAAAGLGSMARFEPPGTVWVRVTAAAERG